MANCPQPHTRRKWVQRILDHDGYGDSEGGIEAWLRLGEAVGREYVALYFPADAKAKMDGLVANVKAAMGARLDALEWMSPATKVEARAKLAGFGF